MLAREYCRTGPAAYGRERCDYCGRVVLWKDVDAGRARVEYDEAWNPYWEDVEETASAACAQCWPNHRAEFRDEEEEREAK